MGLHVHLFLPLVYRPWGLVARMPEQFAAAPHAMAKGKGRANPCGSREMLTKALKIGYFIFHRWLTGRSVPAGAGAQKIGIDDVFSTKNRQSSSLHKLWANSGMIMQLHESPEEIQVSFRIAGFGTRIAPRLRDSRQPSIRPMQY